MLVTDPIADMLTRIRNALIVKHDTVEVPVSVMKRSIADILLNEGYIKGYTINEEGVEPMMVINLKYGPNRQKVITGHKRISKPGLRKYVAVNEIPAVLDGMGLAIVSTSKGVMSGAEAKKAKLGGEIICTVA